MFVFTTLLASLIMPPASALPISSAGAAGGSGGEERDIDIAKINKGLNLHEGDIQLMTVYDRNAVLEHRFKWDIPVPYVFDESLDLSEKGVILRAFDQIRLKTCIDFKPRKDERNYIAVIKGDGCWSYVGNQRQGKQSLSIGKWCDHLYIVEHEFLHALGFWHEQSRYDRDEHVTIVWENIEEGMKYNFFLYSSEYTTTLGTMYDYTSVMHYGKDDYSNGNGSTIITKLPEYQEIIGQPLEMSSNDVWKLQTLYNCKTAVTFLASCSFEVENACGMSLCAAGGISWERADATEAGPLSDNTTLTSQGENQMESAQGNDTRTNQTGGGFFMHCSTASGKIRDGAKMQSRRMNPKRQRQCLQFFYFHSGSDQDQLNIWIREYDEEDKETTYLMGQIIGPPTSHWELQHIPLNASRTFQVEFEVRKGPGDSSGGVSVDDINLFEMECPHHVWHISNFDQFLTNSSDGTILPSPRFVSGQSYGLQLLLYLYAEHFGVYFRLVSTDHDDRLQWPCARRQVTVSLLDQSSHIQQRMSKQISITTDSERTFSGDDGKIFHYWGNPRKVGHLVHDTSGESFYAGPSFGYWKFLSFDIFRKLGNFMRGGSVFFLLSFDDLSNLQPNGSGIPKTPLWSDLNNVTLLQADDNGTCLNHLVINSTTASIVVSPQVTSVTSSLPGRQGAIVASSHKGTTLSTLTSSVALMAGLQLMTP